MEGNVCNVRGVSFERVGILRLTDNYVKLFGKDLGKISGLLEVT